MPIRIKLYQVDAFTDKLFAGNPAAVCPLDNWISDELMQNIALENNLAETAFIVKKDHQYEIRWFTPAVEVDLCGHATLASAFVLFNFEGQQGNVINFHSPRSGPLTVTRNNDMLTLNFPADPVEQVEPLDEMLTGFDIQPTEAYKGKTDYMLLFGNEEEIKNLKPDYTIIAQLNARGIIVTAKGKEVDFVSRFFGPQSGINEDPVTGSAHTTLTPFWSNILGKKELTAKQLSPRGGYLECRDLGDRVEISGKAKSYLIGEIIIND